MDNRYIKASDVYGFLSEFNAFIEDTILKTEEVSDKDTEVYKKWIEVLGIMELPTIQIAEK